MYFEKYLTCSNPKTFVLLLPSENIFTSKFFALRFAIRARFNRKKYSLKAFTKNKNVIFTLDVN